MNKLMFSAAISVSLLTLKALAVNGVDGTLIHPAQEAAKVKGCKISKPGDYKVSAGDVIELDYTYPVVPGAIPTKVDYEVTTSGRVVKAPAGFRTISVPGMVGVETIAFFFDIVLNPDDKLILKIDGEKYTYNFIANVKGDVAEIKRAEWATKLMASSKAATTAPSDVSAALVGPGAGPTESPPANTDFWVGDAVNIEVPAGSKNGDYIFLMRVYLTDSGGKVIAQNTLGRIVKMKGGPIAFGTVFDVDVPAQKAGKYEVKTTSSVIEPLQTAEKSLDEKKAEVVVK